MFQLELQDPLVIQREMNENSCVKFYCKFEIGFQINLGVLLALASFQKRPPIEEIFEDYYLNC